MFTQESENDSRRMTAFILILNMPKNGNGKLFFLYFYCIRQLSVGFRNF